ncbi:TPA: glycosyltransferase, partial [Escherichia coli]|nr:glycosyltransferase [Escherichia coli]
VIDGAGIDINHFTFSEEQQSEPPKILFASRMLWSKGLGDLVQVKNILKHDGLDIEILVAGIIIENDDDAISLNQIQKWNDSGDIVWLGTRNDVKELIQLSNIVALPSIYGEGVPRILLEAGA